MLGVVGMTAMRGMTSTVSQGGRALGAIITTVSGAFSWVLISEFRMETSALLWH